MTLPQSIHFIGAAGIGMQGLACLCLSAGMRVSGSDQCVSSPAMTQLHQKGMAIIDEKDSLGSADPNIVVYSTAVRPDHHQRQWALQRQRLWHRSECLAFFFHQHERRVAVAGTHGKTTISSWVAFVLKTLQGAGCCVGGYVQPLDLSAWPCSEGSTFVIEADESDGSLDKYQPTTLVVSNLEADHLDYWRSPERLFDFVKAYIKQAPEAIICADDPLLSSWGLPATYYGFSDQSDLCITRFVPHSLGSTLDLRWKGKSIGTFTTSLWGRHNALNAAAVLAVALKHGCDLEQLRLTLPLFKGAKRRLENLGSFHGMICYDDYAHHPSEVIATLEAVRNALGPHVRIRVIFQPHRATRLQSCLQEFCNSFFHADELWICPLYLAGEAPIENVNSMALAAALMSKPSKLSIKLLDNLPHALDELRKSPFEGVCITMGAGDITWLLRELVVKR